MHIGHTECIVTELGYNYLVCEPPYEQPENRVDSNSDTVPVDVSNNEAVYMYHSLITLQGVLV